MKKTILYFFVSFFVISVTFAKLNLNKAISSVATSSKNSNTSSVGSLSIDKSINNALKSVQDELISKLDVEIKKFEETINKNVTGIVSKFEKEIQDASNKVNSIIKKAESLTNDIENQYKSLVAMKDKAIKSGMSVIAKLPTIILYIKIFAISIVLLFVLMVFFFWRAYRNVKKLSKELIDLKLNSKFEELESKINQLLNK